MPVPPPIRTDESNAFANDTMRRRIPIIIDEILTLNPDYHASIQQALQNLKADIVNDKPIRLPAFPAPDYDEWVAYTEPYQNDTWQNTVWFYAENVFYRHVIEAVRWWETQRDPFAPKKNIEMNSSALWQLLEQSFKTNLEERLHLALWGNRIDLSYEIAVGYGAKADASDLLANDTHKILDKLQNGRGVVHYVADNYGTEFAMDTMLIDAFLQQDYEVVLHVKLHPVFVSDVIVADVWNYLARLANFPPDSPFFELGTRLRLAFDSGRLKLAPDRFWTSPRFLWQLPTRLGRTFENAFLVIFKGDANYRRITGDTVWPEGVSFAEAVDYFPAPLVTLRTLKSDPIVGLPVGMAAELDTIDAEWRVNGKRGVIQSNL